MSEKKKKSFVAKFLIGLVIFFLIIVLLIGGLLLYSSLDKKKSISVLPHDYSVYLHTDSVWKAVEPLLDLQAADLYLTTPQMASVRGILMQLRASEWRENKFLAFVASKAVDAALYQDEEQNQNILACIDLGALSVVSRFAKYYYGLFKIKNLTYEDGKFVFDSDGTFYYVKMYKNLIVFSNNQDLLSRAFETDYNNYSPEDLKVIKQKTDDPIQVVVNARKLLDGFTEDEGIVSELSKVIEPDSLSSVSFTITDKDIKLNAHIPYKMVEDETFTLKEILNTKSTTPAILSRLKENVQYYTLLNAGTLEQMKNAFMPLFLDNSDEMWNKFDKLSESILKVSLNDLLFSWSGKEIAIFGIENKNDPVFAIQVVDEKKRQEVFKSLTESILIKDNSSLILDGVRIPCLELPDFLQDLLGVFEVSLPKPYYLVQDGFIYFSESEENLSEIYKVSNQLGKISADENWTTVSKGLSNNTTISLYYDLARSVPFFLKSKASIAKVLSLYSLGRLDIGIKNSEFIIQLSAISDDSVKTNDIPGFPIDLEGKPDGDLQLETYDSKAKTNAVYWVENKNTLVSMETPSTAITRLNMNDSVFVLPLKNQKDDNKVWCVTSHGEVYLMNRKFEYSDEYPVMLNDNVSVKPAVTSQGIYVITDNGKFYFVDLNGQIREIEITLFGSVKSTPSVYEMKNNKTLVALYDKSFFGKIIVIQDWEDGIQSSVDVPGISYGSPAFMENKGGELPYVGFVLQKGQFYLWDLNTKNYTTVDLNGLYRENAVAIGDNFYVVSTDGLITKIGLDEQLLSVQIPNVTCNDVFITVIDNQLYICPDGNVIYGFDKNLELLYPFPVTGWGRPVFTDINGDKVNDCFTLSVDKKLFVKNMR